jgi:hypothetical protein
MLDVSFDDTNSSIYELNYIVDSDVLETQMEYSWEEIENSNSQNEITTITGAGFIVSGLDTGLAWSEIEDYVNIWNSIDDHKTWNEIELLHSSGLSWNSLESRQFTWSSWTSELDAISIQWDWNYLETFVPDISLHKAFCVEIPNGQYMNFRVRGIEGNDTSEYLYSLREYIVVKDNIEFFMTSDELFIVELDSEAIHKFNNAEFSLY